MSDYCRVRPLIPNDCNTENHLVITGCRTAGIAGMIADEHIKWWWWPAEVEGQGGALATRKRRRVPSIEPPILSRLMSTEKDNISDRAASGTPDDPEHCQLAFEQRLAGINQRIELACARSDRTRDDVRLLPVSKTVVACASPARRVVANLVRTRCRRPGTRHRNSVIYPHRWR